MNVAQIVAEVSVERSSLVGRPTVRGKFLYVGMEKFWVRGISYGTFFVDDHGEERFTAETVERDFAQMAANGFNVVRVHTGPPRWLLDVAVQNGLRVMVGLNWGEHMAFLDEPGKVEEIEARIRRWIRVCAGHPGVFGYSIGNEIPASIVRWHGRRRVEKFIERLYRIAKEEDPDALVTYVNYPSTEYLRLPFLDFVSFNVYLESRRSLEDYLARLHSLSDDRPVLLSEIGLDSLRNGEEKQASMLAGQVRAAFRVGCAGVVVFAWTDEWYHGKFRVEDWAFGLTTRDRTPKPALQAVSQALAESPFPPDMQWPKISVVVSTLNGAATLRDTLAGLEQLDYPDYEVIVVNDGSTDATPKIASEYHVRLITTKNQGLSAARNLGTQVAAGEIVAFIDDDAYPEIHWLRFLALAFMEGKYVGVGGPNLPPPNDGWIADAVANAPGGPNPVLLSDTVAEHIPGCNMAFRKEALEAIGGFDRVFRAAGDDVDVCWRLRDRGGLIGYTPAAVVWHQASRLREGRGPAGAQVAGSIQFDRATELARAPLRQRRLARSLGDARSRVPGRLGHRAVPVPLRIPQLSLVPGSCPGVVLGGRPSRGDVPPEPRLGCLDRRRTDVARGHRDSNRASLDQRPPCQVRRDETKPSVVAHRSAVRRAVPASHAADGSPFREDAEWPDPVAETRPEDPTPVPARADDVLAGPAGSAGGNVDEASGAAP